MVLYYTLFHASVRARSHPYLSRRFPGRKPFLALWDSYRLNLEIGRVLVDRAVLGIQGAERLRVELGGREEIAALLAEGRGVVLVTAHVGCWQLAMSSLSSLNTPVNILMPREEGDPERQFFVQHRQNSPCTIIDPAGSPDGSLQMLQVLKRGELLCIMGDAILGGDEGSAELDFLGGRVSFPITPYRLATASGAPIAVIFPYRTGDGRYALELAAVIRVPEALGSEEGSCRPYLAQFASALERFTAEHPYQFFNSFDMWKARR